MTGITPPYGLILGVIILAALIAWLVWAAEDAKTTEKLFESMTPEQRERLAAFGRKYTGYRAYMLHNGRKVEGWLIPAKDTTKDALKDDFRVLVEIFDGRACFLTLDNDYYFVYLTERRK